MQDEASYLCDACGEEIVIPIDFSQGSSQQGHRIKMSSKQELF